jgi:hypothetical protein
MNRLAQGLKRCIRSFAHSQSTGLRIPTESCGLESQQDSDYLLAVGAQFIAPSEQSRVASRKGRLCKPAP